jgi:uncharacterized protein (TIGR02453 family)
MAFPGFSKKAMKWFRDLKKNNDRDWFNEHKPIYEAEVKEPMIQLVESVNAFLVDKMPAYAADVPKKAIFRIYRDTRFSKDKTPYKTYTSAVFHRRSLTNSKSSGFYFAVSPKCIHIAGGCYMPSNEELLAIRTRIASEFEDFQRVFQSKKLTNLMGEMGGDSLKRIPKGFDKEHPAEHLLRMKQFHFGVELDAALATSPKLEKEITKRFLVMGPFVDWLHEPLIEQSRQAELREKFLR